MKSTFFTSLAVSFLVVGSTTLTAQKIAHINAQDLLDIMPEKIKVDEQLKVQAEKIKQDLTKEEENLKNMAKKFEAEAKNKSQDELKKMQQTYMEAVEKFEKMRRERLEALEKQQAELYRPILNKAQNAIDKVSKEKGFEYVLDSSQPTLLFIGGYDLMNDVKKELGIIK